MKQSTEQLIVEALAHARVEHPRWPANEFEAMCIITEEVGEIAQALNDGDLGRAREEAGHVLATVIRFLEEGAY